MTETNNNIYRILIVDDEPIICELLAEVLRAPSRSVETRDNGHAALEFLERNPVDLAFLDVRMPGMSGLELAQRIKEKSPRTHIVICTGYYTREICDRAQELQVDQVFEKPLNFGELLQVADSLTN